MVKKLAIVSSYNEECGAAYYSSRLLKHFTNAGYQVDVKRLPVSLLRISRPAYIRQKGDREIQRIASEIKDYDCVLLQFEPGLYGTNPKSSYRRVAAILKAAKLAVVTVHGFDRGVGGVSPTVAFGSLLSGKFGDARAALSVLAREANAFWRYVVSSSHIRVLTFCRADQILLQRYFDVSRISNYPISYFDQEEVARIRESVDREKFLRRFGLDPRKKYFAVCGFLSPYKGHLTAMKALEYLPDDWNLAIVGGEHPHGIEADRDIGRYVRQLLAFSVESEDANSPKAALSVRSNSALGDIFTRGDANRLDIKEQLFKSTDFKFFLPKEELRSRISYLGQVSDEAMPQFYAALDYVVHPYIKTRSGQSGSGPATLAIEFGARSLFTNVPVFREMSEYFKDAMAFFNVGNFIELSEALTRFDGIENEISVNRKKALATYNPAGMIDAYRNLIEA